MKAGENFFIINEKGFTLIELLGVMAIIATLIGLAAPSIANITVEAEKTAVESDLNSLERELDLFYLEHGEYPSQQARYKYDQMELVSDSELEVTDNDGLIIEGSMSQVWNEMVENYYGEVVSESTPVEPKGFGYLGHGTSASSPHIGHEKLDNFASHGSKNPDLNKDQYIVAVTIEGDKAIVLTDQGYLENEEGEKWIHEDNMIERLENLYEVQ